jgi:hypothetical protein
MNIILVNGIPDDDQWRDHESALESLKRKNSRTKERKSHISPYGK